MLHDQQQLLQRVGAVRRAEADLDEFERNARQYGGARIASEDLNFERYAEYVSGKGVQDDLQQMRKHRGQVL